MGVEVLLTGAGDDAETQREAREGTYMIARYASRPLGQVARRLACGNISSKRSNFGVRQPNFSRARTFAASASASDAGPMDSYRVLIYDYVPDILEKRGPHRAEHIGNAKKMAEQGKMAMAGAFADPVDGALFIFKNASE